MAYVTLSEFKSYIAELTGGVQASFSIVEDALLQTFLNEAQADLEKKTERRFEGVTATRKYGDESVYGATLLLDDDLISITTLTNGDGVVMAPTDYMLLPRNKTPKHGIRLISTSWVTTTDVQVDGVWGFSATSTEDVKRLIKRIAFFFWQKRTATGETVVVGESAVQVAAEYPADIKQGILLHKRKEWPA